MTIKEFRHVILDFYSDVCIRNANVESDIRPIFHGSLEDIPSYLLNLEIEHVFIIPVSQFTVEFCIYVFKED